MRVVLVVLLFTMCSQELALRAKTVFPEVKIVEKSFRIIKNNRT